MSLLARPGEYIAIQVALISKQPSGVLCGRGRRAVEKLQ